MKHHIHKWFIKSNGEWECVGCHQIARFPTALELGLTPGYQPGIGATYIRNMGPQNRDYVGLVVNDQH
jgi:hypothetical protein